MRRLPPIAIMLLLHISCIQEPVQQSPANISWLANFMGDGLIRFDHKSGSSFSLTDKGTEWLERILHTLPPRGYGGEAEGFYIIDKLEPIFANIESARVDAMSKIKGWRQTACFRQGAFILKAIELIEPVQPDPQFKTTYLS